MGSTKVNSRVDRQTDSIPIEWLTNLQNDINQLKVGYQSIGPDSLIIQRVATGNTWDINGYAVAANTQQQWRVLFTPSKARSAYAELTYSMTVSGADGFEYFYLWPDTSNTSATARAWIFTISNDVNAINLYVQFVLKCIDTGSITVVKL
jgi:hypothetical protein